MCRQVLTIYFIAVLYDIVALLLVIRRYLFCSIIVSLPAPTLNWPTKSTCEVTPPSAVGYANGIAQSIVSLARCVGPVIGGYVSVSTWNRVEMIYNHRVLQLWSASVQDGPSGYYLGFVVCAAVCALTVLQSFLIRWITYTLLSCYDYAPLAGFLYPKFCTHGQGIDVVYACLGAPPLYLCNQITFGKLSLSESKSGQIFAAPY